MKVYVIQRIETVDGVEDTMIFEKLWRSSGEALKEVQEDAIEHWEMFTDPNNPSPEDRFPGLDVTSDGKDVRVLVKDTDVNADHQCWLILERELD